jgi:hypothetical protein
LETNVDEEGGVAYRLYYTHKPLQDLMNHSESVLPYQSHDFTARSNKNLVFRMDSVMIFSTLDFFRQTTPLGPMAHRLKLYRTWIRILEDIRSQKSTPRYAAPR